MRTLLLCAFLSFFFYASSQEDCKCLEELDFVVSYYERNLPAYHDNVNAETQVEYDELKSELRKQSKADLTETQCFKLLTYYVEFFKDNHSGIRMRMESVDESDEKSVEDFVNGEIFQSRETFDLSQEHFTQFPFDDVKGIYETKDGTYKIVIVEDRTPLRDYVGVILESKSKLWIKGQIKLELKEIEAQRFNAFVYMRNHSLIYKGNYKLRNGILGDGWFKTSKTDRINHASDVESKFDFQILEEDIGYLTIPTFSGGYSAMIDSLYKVADPEIKRLPYLIIDVRNNGGGSDKNAMPLLDYIYTKPITRDVVGVYATEDNAKMWEKWYEEVKEDKENYSRLEALWFKREAKKLRKAKPGTYIPRSKGGQIKRRVAKVKPQKVIVLYNRNCASSCETLIFWAKESGNTVLAGESSGGYVGYGEVGTIETPCYGYFLRCTMTRYETQRKYEVDGIAPEVEFSYTESWIKQAIELLRS